MLHNPATHQAWKWTSSRLILSVLAMAPVSVNNPAGLFALAGVCALILAICPSSAEWRPIDLYVHDTFFVIAPQHLAIGAALACAVCASVYWSLPRFLGRNLNPSLARLHLWFSLSAMLAGVISWIWLRHLLNSIGGVSSNSVAALAFTIPIAILFFLLAQAIFGFNLLWTLLKRSRT
jgi:heme/copper-type cytochrome/quinol oxidase subunit 1